jgi:hypothetical protein
MVEENADRSCRLAMAASSGYVFAIAIGNLE